MHERFYIGLKEYGGQSNEEVGKRIYDYLKSQYQYYPDDNILVVSHGWAIRSFLRVIDKKRLDEYFDPDRRTKNCSISIVDYDGSNFEIIEMFKDVLDT